jgi:hypothetical protein
LKNSYYLSIFQNIPSSVILYTLCDAFKKQTCLIILPEHQS